MNKVKAAICGLSLFSVSAFAALPTPVGFALVRMKKDMLIVAGAFLVATIAVAAVKFIRKGL